MNGIRLIREWFLEGYNKEYFDTYRSEIERYNTGILTFLMRWCCRFWYLCLFRVSLPDMWLPMQPVYVGTAVFTLLEMAADRWMLFKSSRGIEAAAFLCMMKIYIFCIISGVSYSLDMPAISFTRL